MLMNKKFWAVLLCGVLLAGSAEGAVSKGKKKGADAAATVAAGEKKGKKADKGDKADKAADKAAGKAGKAKKGGAVSTAEELNAVLQEAVDGLQPTVKLKLGGALKEADLAPVLEACPAAGALASYSVNTNKSRGTAELALTYHDGTRMGAALRQEALAKKLTAEEQRALATLQERMAAALAAADAAAPEGQEAGNYEKVVAFHNDIVNHARYVVNAETKQGSVAAFINNGVGHCTAYTRLMKMMLDSQNIPNIIIVGESKGPHMWNLVFVEGAWRHVDVTWDDPVMQDGSGDKLMFNYLGLSDADLARDHKWNKTNLPAVTMEPPLYLTRNGLYCKTFAEFWKAAEAAAARGEHHAEIYLENFGSAQKVQQEYGAYMQAGGTLRLRSTRCPQGETSGAVILEF